MSFTVRHLTGEDVAIYRDIRLQGLRTDPASFGASLEEDGALTDDGWRARLERNHAFGLFDGGSLVGIAGFYIEGMAKVRHRGHLVGVYLRAAARGKGGAQMLLGAVIEQARGEVKQLHLAVTTDNDKARRLYERMGFVIYGEDPRGLRVGDRYYDDYLMVLRLD